MNNLLFSIPLELRIIIIEIISLITITLILSIHSKVKIQNISTGNFSKTKLILIPLITFLISTIIITIQYISYFKISNVNSINIDSKTSQNYKNNNNEQVNQINTKNEITNHPQQNKLINSTIDKSKNIISNNEIQKTTNNNNLENKSEKQSSHNTTKQKNNENSNHNGIVYLTFDDGPSSITHSVLDILKKYNVKATFFIIHSANYNKTTLQREVNEGHTIGLHAYDHNYAIAYKDDNSYLNGIKQLRIKLKEDTGYDSHYIRFPGGSSNTISKRYSKGIMTRITKMAEQLGYRYYDWNVDDDDAGKAKTADDCYNNVIRELRPNRSNIVLMHDFGTNKKILEALPRIIEYCQNNNYKMLPIDDNTPQIHHGISN